MGLKRKYYKPSSEQHNKPITSNSITTDSDSSTKILYIALIYIAFIVGGIFEEKLYKTQYLIPSSDKPIKFHDAKISLFLISVISSIVSFIGITINKKNLPEDAESLIDNADKVILGVYYIISRYSAESSLQYLDFIVKVIGKSCKSVAIIIITALYNVPIVGAIFQKLINQNERNRKQSATMMDFVKVIITTSSVLLFNYSPSSNSSSSSKDKSFLLGYLLLIMSLFADGLLSLKEKIINNEVHTNPKLKDYGKIMNWMYMFIFSLMTVITTTIVIMYSIFFGDFIQSLSIYMSSKSLVIDILVYSIVTSIGQAILFIFLERYGPLALSLITSVRKVLTVALSIIIFRKPISIVQGISLFLAGAVILIEVLDKQSHKSKEKETKDNESDSKKQV